jgi:hypothetical protein
MKVRSGFVSNSSSSSFILALPKHLKSVEDVKSVLFPQKYYPDGIVYAYYDTEQYSVDEVAQCIFNTLSCKDKDVIGEFVGIPGSMYDVVSSMMGQSPAFDDINNAKAIDEYYEKMQDVESTLSNVMCDQFVKLHPNCYFYVGKFADDTNMQSTIEHGNIFDNVPHIKISHH